LETSSDAFMKLSGMDDFKAIVKLFAGALFKVEGRVWSIQCSRPIVTSSDYNRERESLHLPPLVPIRIACSCRGAAKSSDTNVSYVNNRPNKQCGCPSACTVVPNGTLTWSKVGHNDECFGTTRDADNPYTVKLVTSPTVIKEAVDLTAKTIANDCGLKNENLRKQFVSADGTRTDTNKTIHPVIVEESGIIAITHSA
jgi:hypothetical protein